jgi:hypothetical protein
VKRFQLKDRGELLLALEFFADDVSGDFSRQRERKSHELGEWYTVTARIGNRG